MDFIEIFVDCALAEAEARDPKGLYKKARAGEIKNFTGIDDPYEAPANPEIHLHSDQQSLAEEVKQILDVLREQITDPVQIALLDQITSNGSDVFEACSFQDITGQRINKVVRSVTYVEERVNAMIDLWGREDIEALGIELPTDTRTGDEALLNGPQLPGEEISQDEIDKLFA